MFLTVFKLSYHSINTKSTPGVDLNGEDGFLPLYIRFSCYYSY